MKKTLIGLSLIALAGYLLSGGSLSMPQLGISLWLLICIIGFACATIQSLLRKNWISGYICSVITFILLNTHFDWLKVSNGMIIFAAFLAGVGLQFIFQPKKSVVMINEYSGDKQQSYRRKNKKADVVFGSNTRYVNGDVTEVGGDVVFGSCIFYFDNATLPSGEATFSGSAVFSGVKLYVPSDWAVELVGERVFSSVKIERSPIVTTKKLYVTGDLVFSHLEVIYI